MDDAITVRKIRNAIRDHDFRHANEFELHRGIAEILETLGLSVQREVHLDSSNRIDLTTQIPRPAGPPVLLGIEVKIAGKASDVRRQVQRYASFDQLGALMLASTIYRHMAEVMPYATAAPRGNDAGAKWMIAGKPFEVALVNRGML